MKAFKYQFNEEGSVWYQDLVDQASQYNFIPHTVNGFGYGLKRNQMADMVARIIEFEAGALDEYLEDRADTVLTFEDIEKAEKEHEQEQEQNHGDNQNQEQNQNQNSDDDSDDDLSPEKEVDLSSENTPILALFSYSSQEDPSKVFNVIEVKEADMYSSPVKDWDISFMGFSASEEDRSAFFYFSSADCNALGGCSNTINNSGKFNYKNEIRNEAEQIAETFSYSGDDSGEGCFYVSPFDFSLIFPASWGHIDEFAALSEDYPSGSGYVGDVDVCTTFNGEYAEADSSDDEDSQDHVIKLQAK